jgi:hypothetical protein
MPDRRLAFGASTVFCAFTLYGTYAGLILYRIFKFLTVSCILVHSSRPDDSVKLFGVVDIWEIAVAAGFVPVGVLVYPLYAKLRRHYREKHDLCTQCGHPIGDWHGHCAGCGIRIGPDPNVLVHVIRG